MKNLEHKLRKMRLRWFGHVKRRDENSILRGAMELEVEGRRPVGRPKKTWSKIVEEDTRKLKSQKIWQRIENSGGNSYYVRPRSGKLGTINEEDDDDDDDDKKEEEAADIML